MTKRKHKVKKTYRKFYKLIGFQCLKCREVYIFKYSKQFIECGCGASNGDAGDGFYYRLGGQADALMTLVDNQE